MSKCLAFVSRKADTYRPPVAAAASADHGPQILFTSRKGGVGKSTLARAMAIALAAEGRKVLLADFDVEQRTCLRWQAQRLARHLEPAIDVEKFSKGAKLDRVAHRYDDVVLDTPGQQGR